MIKIVKKTILKINLLSTKITLKRLGKLLIKYYIEIEAMEDFPIHYFREKNKDVSFSDPVVIANRFNEYFVSVGTNLAKKNPKDDTTTFKKYLKGNYKVSMFAEPMTEHEIITKIDQLKSNKGEGHDEFQYQIDTNNKTRNQQTSYTCIYSI